MEKKLGIFYNKLIDQPGVVYTFAFLLFISGVISAVLNPEYKISGNLTRLINSGDLLYSLYIAILVVLVIVGTRIDDRPGKSIILALVGGAVGSFARLMVPFVQSNNWLGEWNGVMLAIILISLYISFRIGARFAVMTIVVSVYTMIVTGGIVYHFIDGIRVSNVLVLLAIGMLTVLISFLSYSHVKSFLQEARRQPVSHSVRGGMSRAINFITIFGIGIFLLAFPSVIFTTGLVRDYSLIIIIGIPVSVCAILMTAIPLVSLTNQIRLETSNPGRGAGRRRR